MIDKKQYHREKSREQYEKYKDKQKISILGNYYIRKIYDSRNDYSNLNDCIVNVLKNCKNIKVWNDVCEKLCNDEIL